MLKNIYTSLVSFFIVCNLNAQSAEKIIASIKTTSFKTDTFSIVSFGAKGDGLTLNTTFINEAIANCSKKGGGVVNIPSGIWLTGPVNLKSNVNLHLTKNCLLLFTTDFSKYLLVKGSYEGLVQMRNQSPIWANNENNIAITGEGIIDASGEAWRMVSKEITSEKEWKKLVASGGVLNEKASVWYPSHSSLKGSFTLNPGFINAERDSNFYKEIKDFLRPNLLVFTKCNNILLQNITIQNSPNWNIHLLESNNIIVKSIAVRNPINGQNSDGVDIESCSKVLVEDCSFDVGDDGICIKSGRDEEGRLKAMPTQEVVVKSCTVFHAHGGFVIGSEMSGDVRNVYVSNCTFIGTDVGLRFKSRRGRGGIVEQIYINNIYMNNIAKEAISFDMLYPKPGATEEQILAMQQLEMPIDETTPVFKNIHISNIICVGAQKALFVRGLAEMPIQGIELNNLNVQSHKGIDIQDGSGINITNAYLKCNNTNPLINIFNSKNIKFNKIDYNPVNTLFYIKGKKSTTISITDFNKQNFIKQVIYDNDVVNKNAVQLF